MDLNHHLRRLWLIMLLVPIASAVKADAPLTATTAVEVSNCGVQSVLSLARLLGKMPSQTQADALCRAYPQSEVSMFDVQQAAKQIGIAVEGVKATLPELEKRGQPFIAVLPNHFAFVERVEGDWVRYQVGEGFQIESRAQFESKYQGKALALAANQPSNALRVSPSIIYWDKVPFGSPEKTATVTLTNTGNAPVALGNVSTSCSCTVPSALPDQLLPGQSVPMQITVRMPFSGEFNNNVIVPL